MRSTGERRLGKGFRLLLGLALAGSALTPASAETEPSARHELLLQLGQNNRQTWVGGEEAQPQLAQAAVAPRGFDIPAQALAGALTAFGQQADLQVTVDAALVRDRRAPAVRGTLVPEEALRRLLAGSNLTYDLSESGTVAIEPLPTGGMGTVTLDPLRVEAGAPAESAWGPVDGFVASRSASGTKTDTPLIETPQSISVVPREQIGTTNATSLGRVLAYTPGVTVNSPGPFAETVDDFMIRGFNVANGNLGMLRDGMKLQSNVYDGSQEPYGLERVEVLRGPASVLYGQLSPGGAINAISKRPTDRPFREINLEYGRFNHKQVSADFGGPVTDDGSLSLRLTGLLRDADTSVDHFHNNRRYIAPALAWRPTERTSLTLLASYQETRTRFAAPLPYAVVDNEIIDRDRFIGEPDFDRYDTNVYTAGYVFEHAFNDRITFRSSARYFHSDVKWDYLTFGGLAGDVLSRGVSFRREESTGITADNSLELRFETGPARHSLLAGVDFYRSTYDRNRHPGTAAPLNIRDPDYGNNPIIVRGIDIGDKTVGRQVGLYLQDQIKLYDRVVLLLGGRYDWSRSRVTSYFTGATTRQNDSALTGRGGLVYLFDNGLAPYVSFSQSFAPEVGTDRQGDAFEPTRGTQYEAGIRYQPPETNLLLSAAVYQLTRTNVRTPDPVDPSFSVQSGKVRSRGLELEGRTSIDALNLVAAYAYTDARTIRDNNPALENERVFLIPRHAASLWADYGLDDVGLRGLRVGAGVQYLGSTNIPGFDRDVPSRTLVDAMVRYDFGAIDERLQGAALTLNVSNLFDRNYYTCVNANGCRYGAPRMITAKLSYRW